MTLLVAWAGATAWTAPELLEIVTASEVAIARLEIARTKVRDVSRDTQRIDAVFTAYSAGPERPTQCSSFQFTSDLGLTTLQFRQLERLQSGQARGTIKFSTRRPGHCWIESPWMGYGILVCLSWGVLLIMFTLYNGWKARF